ncbi:MAG: histidine ammonia-lyase [Thermoanaerobaculia bacterium]
MSTIQLDGESLGIQDVVSVARGSAKAELTEEARVRMRSSRALVEKFVAEGRTVYGITTGFGVFSEVSIPPDQVLELQRRLILSHCAGLGEPYPDEVSRAMMLLRANALAKGCSGVRVEVVELLLAMLNAGLAPVIPSQGSVGASGDLAPLAHLASTLIGEGSVRLGGSVMPAREALASIGRAPVVLQAKEGLALINGTQAICAMASLALDRARMLLDLADLFATMTLDALRGTDAAFDARIHAVRPHAGQTFVAARMRGLLAGSEIRDSHRDCGRVQDAYSLRCVPQVHGAVRDAVEFAVSKIAIEINSATDNPLIFVEDETVVSGGNFHGAPVAMACDVATLALVDLASISERRIERLVNPQLSELPPFLVKEGGLNSGFMIAQVTAAALVSESKALSHPASVDSIPTSANKEDHVSMGPTAAWKLSRVVENVAGVLAIEAMCAAQALEFRRPLRSSKPVEGAHAAIREKIAPWDEDRYLHADLVAALALLPALHPFAKMPA